jgi:hypothetical protein
MRTDPPEARRWCALGCGAELAVDQTPHSQCPRCHRPVVDLGWRYRDNRGALHYASTWETLPPEIRRST